VREAIRDASRLPQLPSGRVLIGLGVVLVVAVVLIVWAASGSDTKPLIARNCSSPGIAVGRPTTGDGRDIAWAITGPQAGAYTVTVDGRTIATPKVRNCTASGTLPPLPPGTHRVELRDGGRTVASVGLRP
jgi:hypothetical protein